MHVSSAARSARVQYTCYLVVLVCVLSVGVLVHLRSVLGTPLPDAKPGIILRCRSTQCGGRINPRLHVSTRDQLIMSCEEKLFVSSAFESQLVEEQRSASNLTSFEVYPFPSKLVEICYPLDSKGCIVPPEVLGMYSRSHTFSIPRCFHGRESSIITVNNFYGDGRNSVHFICGAHGEPTQCRFHIDVKKLLRDNAFVMGLAYTLRPCGSPNSSVGISSPVSLPSIESLVDQPRSDVVDQSVWTNKLEGSRSSNSNSPSSDSLSSDSLNRSPGLVEEQENLPTDLEKKMYGQESPGLEDKEYSKASTNTKSNGSQRSRRKRSKKAASVNSLYDEYAYPLLARADGISSIVSCLDPTTGDFSNDRFLSQIVDDASSEIVVQY